MYLARSGVRATIGRTPPCPTPNIGGPYLCGHIEYMYTIEKISVRSASKCHHSLPENKCMYV
jgi:hypothetical protein